MIRRKIPDRLAETEKLLSIRSSTSEITDALNRAFSMYMSLITNRNSVLGELIRYTTDEIIPNRELDIVYNYRIRAEYIKNLNSFMKLELGAYMTGELLKRTIAGVIKENIEALNRFCPESMTFDVHSIVSRKEYTNVTIDKYHHGKKAESIIISIGSQSISFVRGTISNRHDDTDIIRETELI